MTSSAFKPKRLEELDALRGIAAVGVVAYHYATCYPEIFPAAHHIPVGFAFGHNAVLLFFAISGFVIASTMGKLERASDFMVKRFARPMARLIGDFWT